MISRALRAFSVSLTFEFYIQSTLFNETEKITQNFAIYDKNLSCSNLFTNSNEIFGVQHIVSHSFAEYM